MYSRNYRSLIVWQKARDLTVAVHRAIQRGPLARDTCLHRQLWRAAISVPSNIAEGYERHTTREMIQFLYIARGSLAEVRTQLEIANLIAYITLEEWEQLDALAAECERMIWALIKARSHK